MKEHIMTAAHINQIDISIRELKARPAQAIAKAQSGMRVNITSHKKTVANLVAPIVLPADALEPRIKPAQKKLLTGEEAIQKMIAAGMSVTPASTLFSLPPLFKLAPLPNGQTMSDLVIEMRGPR
jgi:antitoxin (DNA-binding transcriptional repressor) of toxin-antitoxin stability system